VVGSTDAPWDERPATARVKQGRRVAKFVSLKDNASGSPVAVHPDHVVLVLPSPEDSSITMLHLQNGSQQPVQGGYADMLKLLSS
jgi:hypothetical protein